jgi:DNA-binding transcriptional ArsR family regulator
MSGMSRRAASDDAFRAIADPTRRAVLDLLRKGERPVHELGRHFRMTQPALSQHLRVLRGAGLVAHRRAGRARLYRIRPSELRPVADWVVQYERFWRRKLHALGDYLDRDR